MLSREVAADADDIPGQVTDWSGTWTGIRVVWMCAAVGLIALIATALFIRLGSAPPQHGDEAWIGLFALHLRDTGLDTPHGMNTYTSPLYAWLLAQVFRITSPNQLSLRLPGTGANLCAAVFMALHLGRRFGGRPALIWLLFLTATPMFLLKSRIAWDVYALQYLLMTAVLILLARLIDGARHSWTHVAALLLVIDVGVLNHFIFLSVPLSLTVLVLFMLTRARDWSLLPLARAVGLSLLVATMIACGKLLLDVQRWQAGRTWILVGFVTLPFVAARGFRRWPDEWDQRAQSLIAHWLTNRRAQVAGRLLLTAGFVAFGVIHLVALEQIVAGGIVVTRVLSWKAPVTLASGLHVWSVLLLVLVVVGARHGLRQPDRYLRLLTLWPLAYMALFTIVRVNATFRHYHILMFLLLVSWTLTLSRLPATRRHLACAALIVVAGIVQASIWRALSDPSVRPPVAFRLGWWRETSEHYRDLTAVYDTMSREHVCAIAHTSYFLEQPLRFSLATRPFVCDPSKVITVQDCLACGAPFVRWTITRP